MKEPLLQPSLWTVLFFGNGGLVACEAIQPPSRPKQASFFTTPITVSNQSSLQSLLLCYSMCCKDPQSSESPRLGESFIKEMFLIYRYIYRDFFLSNTFLSKFILKRWKPTLDLLTLEYEYMTPLLQVQNITGLCLFKWIFLKNVNMLIIFIYKLYRSLTFYMRVGQTVHSRLCTLSPKCCGTFPTVSTPKSHSPYIKISCTFFWKLNILNHII